MDAVEIRTTTTDDLEGVVASSAALFAEDSGTRDPLRNADWPVEHGAKWIADLLENPDAVVLTAFDTAESAVVGHLVGTFSPPSEMWLAPRAEMVSIYVRETHRTQGVGSRLVDSFTDWARNRGAVRVGVTGYVANDSALHFYHSHGFNPIAVTLTNEL